MPRLLAALFAASFATALAACGSSTQTITGPSTNKCAVTVTADTASFTAGGGSGNITVSTNRECQWTAQSSTAWVKLGSGSSGQGDGKVSFTVTANTDPTVRRGTVNVNDQQVTISEEAAPCQFTVSPLADTVSPAGERHTVAVTTSSAQCAWTAKSNIDWLAVESGAQGTGNGTVMYSAQPTAGPTRSGSLTVAGQTVAITQGNGCSVAISPTGQPMGASGGSGSISVTAGAGCTWTATSGVPWITLTSGTTGAGPGSVNFTVAAWDGPARTGTITINGQVFTVTQGAGCSFSLSSSSTSIGAAGGSANVQVISADGCSWNSSSNASWIAITSGGNGSGRGTVQFSVAQNTGSARDGTLMIAGQPFVVKQAAAACTYSINPQSATFSDALPHSASFALTTRSDCSWTASPSASWIQVSNSSGNGSATINFNILENMTPGPSRSGNISVGGQTFSISQAAPACSFNVSLASGASQPATGGSGSIHVDTATDCAWTASTDSPSWITLATTNGSGVGDVGFTVTSNPGGARTGTITVAGQIFTINQAAPCSSTVTLTSGASQPATGGSGSIHVDTATGCAWTALTDSPSWITLATTNGSGVGDVGFTVTSNPGGARTGTITVAGQIFTISQAAPCSFTVTLTSGGSQPATGGSGSIHVDTATGCAWTALTDSPSWITLATTNGSGVGDVGFTVAPNPGPAARNATIAVGGQSFTVSQGAP